MPDLLSALSAETREPVGVILRLAAAMLLGGVVAQVYRRTRAEPASSFTTTLVLLAILIAMVTQVIGDNVARAFSLVGALSIVRFRTVVRDTEDTAYVIFAVAIGMAVGAQHPSVAIGGIAVVSVAAWTMRRPKLPSPDFPFRLQVRLGLGHDRRALLRPTLDEFTQGSRMVEVSTARQGSATEITYRVALRNDDSAHDFVLALNLLDGVQGASVHRVDVPVDE